MYCLFTRCSVCLSNKYSKKNINSNSLGENVLSSILYPEWSNHSWGFCLQMFYFYILYIAAANICILQSGRLFTTNIEIFRNYIQHIIGTKWDLDGIVFGSSERGKIGYFRGISAEIGSSWLSNETSKI